jgi:uncharacterized protein YgbK (DUF1537 family)
MNLKKSRRQQAERTAAQAVAVARHLTHVAQALAAPERVTALDAALDGTLGPSMRAGIQALRDDLATLNGIPTKYRETPL